MFCPVNNSRRKLLAGFSLGSTQKRGKVGKKAEDAARLAWRTRCTCRKIAHFAVWVIFFASSQSHRIKGSNFFFYPSPCKCLCFSRTTRHFRKFASWSTEFWLSLFLPISVHRKLEKNPIVCDRSLACGSGWLAELRKFENLRVMGTCTHHHDSKTTSVIEFGEIKCGKRSNQLCQCEVAVLWCYRNSKVRCRFGAFISFCIPSLTNNWLHRQFLPR